MTQNRKKKPRRENYPWLAWEDRKVKAGIKCRWTKGSQQQLADELERSRPAVQQRSHKFQQKKRRKQPTKLTRSKKHARR